MREIRVRIPTPDDIICGEFGKHVLKAYKEFLLAVTSTLNRQVERIEELERRFEEKRV